jgi:hypothetical protein
VAKEAIEYGIFVDAHDISDVNLKGYNALITGRSNRDLFLQLDARDSRKFINSINQKL